MLRLRSNTFLLFIFFISLPVLAQQKFTLSGTISDATTNESLIGVSISIPEAGTGTTTNSYGFYSITLPQGKYTLVIQYLGFRDRTEVLDLGSDLRQNFTLTPESEELEEVVVSSSSEQPNLRTAQMSVNTLPIQRVKDIPVVLGESDVIKSLLLLPGVTSAGEGAPGFNVRGGAVDQNLILLDEATIFNSSHLFGFFSVFNPDAIKDVKLYKGGIPARYGGRLSSVLEIFQKEGNSKDFRANGGIGLVASRLLLEGPMVKDKASFLVGGRSSYAHLFLPLFDLDNKAYFYDLNSKLSYTVNPNNKLYLSAYFGRDVFSISDRFVNTYGNAFVNFRWNHLFSDKLFSNLSLIYSDYYYGLTLDFVGFDWNSGIRNYNIKYDFKQYLENDLQLTYGINNIYYEFNPGRITPSSEESGILEDQLTRKYANELALYAGLEKNWGPLSLEAGLRFSHFTRFGQEEFYRYANNRPVAYDPELQRYQEAIPTDTLNLSKNDHLSTYTRWEPRIALAYRLGSGSALKASYARTAQYLHLISNTNSPTPLDIWTPSGPYIKPQQQDQYALGYYREISEGRFTLETEGFYKDIDQRIDYIDGADLIANNAIERVILPGQARAYGLELLLRKNQGQFTGWLGYTWSRSQQRTPGRTYTDEQGNTQQETGINFSRWYYTPFDKTHDVSLYLNYKRSEKWSFNANMVYQTGQPTNYPEGQFNFEGLSVPYFGPRNSERLPAYHRLDLSATLNPARNKERNWQGEWVFSIYNVYNRKNAASINFRRNQDTGVNEAVKTSIFGIVPSVSYNFKF